MVKKEKPFHCFIASLLFYFFFLTSILYIFSPYPVYPANIDIPQPENNTFTLAKGLYNDGLYDLSVKQFNLFMKDYPDSKLISDAYFYSAEGMYKAERYDEAVLQYGKILEIYPDFVKTDEVIKRIAECSKNVDETEALINIFKNIFERNPEKGYSSGTAYYYANLLYKKKRYNESLWIFERLSEKIPPGIPEDELFYKLGECLYRGGGFRLASERWFHVIKKYPKSNFAEMSLYNLGVLYFIEGDYKESRVRFDKLINIYPESNLHVRAVYGVIWSMLKDGMDEDAAQRLIAHEERERVHEEDIISSIESFNEEDFTTAYDKLKKIIEERPDTELKDEILWFMGRSAEEIGNLKESLEIYQQLIREFPESHHIDDTYINAGKIYLNLRDFDSAVNILKSYREKYPSSNSPQPTVDKGVGFLDIIREADNYLKSEETDRAVELYQKALDKPSEPLIKLLVKNKLREIYLQRNMYKEYIELSLHFINYEPSILEEKINDLKSIKSDDKKQAIAKAENTSKIESGAISLYMTADMLSKSGRPDRASELFKRIINDYPDEMGIELERLNIGLFFLKEKEYDLSIKSFTQVINSTEDNKIRAEAHFWLGEALQGSGRLEDSVIEYLKVAYLYPENDLWSGTARFRAGEILEMQGRIEDAVLLYQKLAVKYKNDERGKFAVKKIEGIKKIKEQKNNLPQMDTDKHR
jgi:TolA-binding protein